MYRQRLVATAVVISLSGAALAEGVEFPISTTYGGPVACALFLAEGGNAVFSAGGSVGSNGPVDTDAEEYIVVSPTEILGFEWACEPKSVTPTGIIVQCPGSQVSPDFGEPELMTVTVRENPASGTHPHRHHRLWSAALRVLIHRNHTTVHGRQAQDVLGVMPQAVSCNKAGFYSVDYGMLGIEMRRTA